MGGPFTPHCDDVLVLGGGFIGVCTALHLQPRGLRACLVDQECPGEAQASGTPGLSSEPASVPYAFPRAPLALVRYALSRPADVRFRWNALSGIVHWLFAAPRPLAQAARDMLPLIDHSVEEHDLLVHAAGLQVLICDSGWIDIYRSAAAFTGAAARARQLASAHGLRVNVLDAALSEREPYLQRRAGIVRGVHWLDPMTVSSPGALVQGYAELFRQRGGRIERADARTLHLCDDGWTLDPAVQLIAPKQAVIALGADASELCARLGYRLPLTVKRGYHLHFRTGPDTPAPRHASCNSQAGFVLAPMDRVRLNTGSRVRAAARCSR